LKKERELIQNRENILINNEQRLIIKSSCAIRFDELLKSDREKKNIDLYYQTSCNKLFNIFSKSTHANRIILINDVI